MRGFFPGSVLKSNAPTVSLIPKCGQCGLYKGCVTPKMRPYGEGKKKILIVGEAPGQTEDEKGRPFVGDSGKMLREVLNRLDIDLDEDCWVTNALICRPPGNKIAREDMVDFCRPNMTKTLDELKPEVIILLGSTAVKSVIGGIWKSSPGPVSRWVGWVIPNQTPNAWICPTWHPSYLMRMHSPLLDDEFYRHIKAAVSKKGRPWDKLPDWESQIEIIVDHAEAAKILREMRQRGGPHAVDLENNCLQPETPGGEIVCASVCHRGKRTIAFPWIGDVIPATQELIHDDNCSFRAANMKHEDRWFRKVFGKGVRHWEWDTMVAQHVIDNRPGICGLKFQAYVYFGAKAYDDHIEEYLQSRKGSAINQVKEEISIRQLLLYCGTDTLGDYLVADKQMDILKFQ